MPAEKPKNIDVDLRELAGWALVVAASFGLVWLLGVTGAAGWMGRRRDEVGGWLDRTSVGAGLVVAMLVFLYLASLGIVVMVVAWWVARRRFVRRARRTEAVVAGCVDSGDNMHRVTVHYVVDGEVRRAELLSPQFDRVETGSTVDVWYDPANPRAVDVVEQLPTTMSRLNLMLFLAAPVSLLAGSAFLVVGEWLWG